MTLYAFSIESMIRGYHEYKLIWNNPVVGEDLLCEREVGNPHDTHAVAVKKVIDGNLTVVGHIPQRISSICSIFMRRGGTINCTVDGSRRYSSDIPQGGLEIPCVLTFTAQSSVEGNKAEKLIESTLSVKCSKLTNPVQGETCAADLLLITSSEEKENLFSQADKIDLTNCDTAQGETQGSPPRKRAKNFDAECVIMGAELSDITINYAQELLKVQFQELNGLQSTLLQVREVELSEAQVKNKLQIIHCSKRHHWIVASTVNCKLEEVQVYDSLFSTIDKETRNIIQNLFQATSCKKPNIKLVRCQKQTGGKDCGVFSIAFATTIAFRMKMTKFHQELMRAHLVECLNKKYMSPFPCK